MKYLRITRRIFAMLGLRLREGALMVALLGLYAALEGFGIGLLLPVLQYLEAGGSAIPEGSIWPYLVTALEFLGLPISLGTLLLIAFVPILLRQFVYYLNTWYAAQVQNRSVAELMVRSFRAVAHARMSYVDAQDQGALISLVSGQTSRCGQALMQYLRLLSIVGVILVYAVLLAILSWQLAAIAVVAMAGVSWGVRRILVSSRAHGAEVTRASVELSSAVRERIAALRLVKMRAQEDAETERVGRLASTLRTAGTNIAVAAARVEVLVDPALMLAVFVIVYTGVTEFGLTLASLGLFMFILLRLNAKAKEFNLGRQALAAAMPAFDYVERMLAEAEAVPTPRGGDRVFTGLQEAIRFEDVGFSYKDGDGLVLKGVSFSIQRGSLTAIVGRSGAGKSTLVDIIPLLRVPDSGAITFDGIPVAEFDLVSLRRRIGFLTQEPILFNDTIRNNLTYGLAGTVDEQRIIAALDASYATEFVSRLPAGLETRLGDRGVRFSGGQRQRLALARALLQDPDILILDEPTSALDSESEAYIQKALDDLHGRTTLVVIAHRLSTVENADQILVLSEGAIVEVGRHEDLMTSADGTYRRLFDKQIRA
jgi:ABC-type multidrug transport system fused ATPase/permease subunit